MRPWRPSHSVGKQAGPRPSISPANTYGHRPRSDGALKVVLVSLTRDVSEITALVHSAGHELVDTIVQARDAPDRRYFVGKGKLEEIAETLEGRDVDVVLFNGGFHLVSLAGYANAGKSSMLNALTGERVLVEERLFSTLSTTTRAVSGRRRILLTDTVGFVDQVPFWMVDAFNSTFEEIYDSDLILLLIDASDSETEILRKVRLAARTLLPRVTRDAILPVLTKADRVPDRQVARVRALLEGTEFHSGALVTSTQTRQGLPELVDAIAARFAFTVEVVVQLPVTPEGASALSRLYETGEVLHVDYGPRYTEVRVHCRAEDAERRQGVGNVVSKTPTGPG